MKRFEKINSKNKAKEKELEDLVDQIAIKVLKSDDPKEKIKMLIRDLADTEFYNHILIIGCIISILLNLYLLFLR